MYFKLRRKQCGEDNILIRQNSTSSQQKMYIALIG